MGDDDTPDPRKPDDLNVDRHPNTPTEKKLPRGKLAKKRSKRRKQNEPYDPETDAAEREAQGLPPRVVGTMEIDKKVILGFNYPPPPPEDDPDPAGPESAGGDDSEIEITGPFAFLDKVIEWFRRAPIMGTIVLVFGTAVIVVPIVLLSLDGGSSEADPGSVEIIDDVEDDSESGSESESGTVDTESDESSGDTGAVDTESADTESEESSGDTDADGDNTEDANAGIYLGSAVAQDPCGPQEYDVNLRFTWFGNGEVVGEQLYTRGGNAFDTTEGNWEERVAILISEAQIWVMTTGERPRLHNAYLPDGALPQQVPDIGDLAEGMTDEEFREVFGLPPEACVPTFTDVTFDYTPFPPSSSGG